jgi:hypothetical protein
MVFFIAAILLWIHYQNRSLKAGAQSAALYVAITIAVTFALIVCMYGTPAQYVHFLQMNRMDSHGISYLVQSLFFDLLQFGPYIAIPWSCYYMLDQTHRKNRWVFLIACCMALITCYYFIRWRGESYRMSAMFDLLGVVALLFLSIYKCHKQSVQPLMILLLMGCIPMIGSNTGLMKFIALPLLPILYVFMPKPLSRPTKVFGAIYYVALLLYGYGAVRGSSFWDVGSTEATYTISEGLAKGIKTTEAKGKVIQDVSLEGTQYSQYEKIVLRNGSDYVYEYVLHSRNAYLRDRFNGVADRDADYVAWVESEICKGGDKVAIWRFGDCREPSLMTSLLDQCCTKVKETDLYTIYLKDVVNHE